MAFTAGEFSVVLALLDAGDDDEHDISDGVSDNDGYNG
jgi:hypothetical protein